MELNKNTITTAVLMPTYGRPEAIKDTLTACLDLYEKYHFDVYVFDSNGNNETENIITELQTKHDNLYYIRLCEFIHLDCKWLDMVRGKYLKKDYDYLYPCGDANSLTKFSIERVYPYLEQKVDIINMSDFARISKTTEFNKANDFFNSKNMNIGLWAGAIYNRKTIFDLTDEEWNSAISKWFTCDKEFIGLNGFILERISLCENLRIVEPSMDGAEPKQVFKRSKFKQASFWRKDAIKLIAITYPKVYRMLPECYTNVEEKLYKLMLTNFKIQHFKFLKRNSRFNLIDYMNYRKIFKEAGFNVLTILIFIIALIPSKFYKK